MPRVCGKRKRESVGEVATTPDTDNRTSLIASDEQKREAHHQAESPSTVSDNQPLDAKIVVESIRDVPPELSAEQTGQYVIDANANVANQLVESPDKDNNQINIVENESSENAELCSTALSDRDDTNLHARWWLEIVVGKSKIRAMLDSGATHTIMGPLGLQIASECESRVMPTFGAQAKAYDGRTESIIGRAKLPVQVAGVTHTLNVALVNSIDDECLLGADFYRTFNAIVHPRENLLQIEGASERVALEAVTSEKSSRICSLQIGLSEVTELQREEIRQLVDRILPTGEVPVGCTSWAEHRIIVDESQRSVKQRYYPVSKKLEEDMHSEVRELLAAGHIRRSSSEWSSPVVMVRKANGSYRLCIDYRKLNAVTKVSAYPIPNMDIILRKLQSAKFITTLDLSAAFHQVPMSAGSEKFTAFTVPGLGLFEWTRNAVWSCWGAGHLPGIR
ncbi:unnamed protein product [Trichogramma brassicae]|uniref:Reverse transcriptase domain-containing protein n=1 Tax=Trichogramma brassicae TaxID=86971 RepID=A0A6H5IPW7_9HYME|nr:unnamed protein product [Trichogramma brassicae]